MGRKYNVISDVISEARSDVFIRSFPTLINTPTNVGGPLRTERRETHHREDKFYS